jgi:hypothetical protein
VRVRVRWARFSSMYIYCDLCVGPIWAEMDWEWARLH